MDSKRFQEIKNEVANSVIDACGETGVLEAVNNDKLSGDVRTRHKNAMKECERFKDKDGHVNPHIQAIMAHMYGLI